MVTLSGREETEAEAVTGKISSGRLPLVPTRVDVRGRERQDGIADWVAEETPVAMVYNGISYAVMMATPADLENFALGFSLTEGIIKSPDELFDIELSDSAEGITLDMRIAGERLAGLREQRRNMAGRTGCGLCGTESLAQAMRPIPWVGSPVSISDEAIQYAIARLKAHQPLQAETGATHAAAWCDLQGRILVAREDVGRHNALDKLIGSQHASGGIFGEGFALISSRASFEMVQKCAAVGIGCLVAVSAPTGLAIREARKAGMILVGFARPGRHVLYYSGAEPGNNESVREYSV
ncbi:MAG: formate dehydrogenase accessory sulfurtransferase FdhD [Oleiphilaceae bacterium]|nr:formate dehydrogenase accessory sulfurtransferase FdhD [Oleiphilaceae bacterium]